MSLKSKQALYATRVLAACLKESPEDTEAAFAAAQVILADPDRHQREAALDSLNAALAARQGIRLSLEDQCTKWLAGQP